MYTPCNETDTAICEMLLENTGRHFLDSGGAYGRNWERNIGKSLEDFRNEPAVTVEYDWGMAVTYNVFHFLSDHIAILDEENELLQAWEQLCDDNEDTHPFGLMTEFADLLTEQFEGVGDTFGGDTPCLVNTYNEENLLSQTLQYLIFSHDFTDYVLVSVHGGCDVRGGYTAPRLFEADEYFTYNYRGSFGGGHGIWAECWEDGEYKHVESDNGYSWFIEEGDWNSKGLQDYTTVDVEDYDPAEHDDEDGTLKEHILVYSTETNTAAVWHDGAMWTIHHG